MVNNKTIFLFLLLWSWIQPGLTQVKVPTDEELANGTEEQKIEAAEYFYEKKMYLQSLRIWKNLLKDYPDHARINYMAGKCQLLSGREKEKSKAYFAKTLGHVSGKLKLDSKNVEDVPADALFYMGQACHLNEQFDDALKYYQEFSTRLGDKMPDDLKQELSRWTSWTRHAKEMLAKTDQSVRITNMGPVINSPEEDYSPVFSLDQAVMYFTSRRVRADSSNTGRFTDETGQPHEDVYITFLNDDSTWAQPRLMNFGNEPDVNEATVSVSADGTEVYVYVDTEGGGDLYSASFLESGYNAELEHLEGEINSPGWETHCSITPDGQTMFFTSNRPGGMGGLDIYRVVKLPNQQWSKALMLPAPINTPYDEDAPYIHPSGNVLYFSSNNPNGMGGCDVYYSRIIEPNPLVFSEPKNLGSPVNTVDDDVFFIMDPSGNVGYYSSARNGGYGAHDIFRIEFANGMGSTENFAILKGKVKTTDNSPVPDNIVVNVANQSQGDEPLKFRPRPWDGRFVMALKPCNDYEVVYNKGTQALRREIIKVPCNSNYREYYTEIELDSVLLPVGENIATNGTNDTKRMEDNIATNGTNDTKRVGDNTATNGTNDTKRVGDNTATNDTNDKMLPITFEKFFDYNMVEPGAQPGSHFDDLINGIAARVQAGKTVEVVVEASASRVPTTTFKTNDRLSRARSAQIREKLEESLRAKGVDLSKVKFKKIVSLVQGPQYKNDYEANRSVYGKYQYVKITAR